MDDPPRAGLLIIRTWREDGSDSPLRAEVRITHDVSSGSASSVTVAEVEGVLEIVQRFLEPWSEAARPSR